jgi:hypothetical protein
MVPPSSDRGEENDILNGELKLNFRWEALADSEVLNDKN